MKKISKILIIALISFLFVGAVSAVANLDSLKAPTGFQDIKDAESFCKKDNQTWEFYIDSYKDWGFLINDEDIVVKELGDNTYYYIYNDTCMTAGVAEKVKINNTDYIVYILKEGQNLSNDEQKFCKEGLLDFNKKNNLEPTSVNLDV
ncbi:hypothetical protein [Methanobrevibacter sp.]